MPLLSDFGIARALDAPELTSIGRTIGTPTYMSPEQCADSHEIDGRSDLYSLGAVFYRCLVGRPPFSGTTTQILHAHVYDPLTIPEDILADLPALAVQVLRYTLAKDPAERYPTGAHMASDLAALAALPPSRVAANAPEDTATMPALPAIRQRSGAVVLIPAQPVNVASPAGALTGERVSPDSYVPMSMSPVSGPPVKERHRWVGALLGAILSALVLAAAIFVVLNLLPDDLVSWAAPTATLASVGLAPAATQTPRAFETSTRTGCGSVDDYYANAGTRGHCDALGFAGGHLDA